MSIIGTRPPLISETNLYELHHRARLAIKPGITGMWQVSGRSDITDFEEVVRLDKEYITNWNIGLAILGNGLDICYPAEHNKLMKCIEEKGLLISEYPPGTHPDRYRFPRRNRLISSWSDKLFVIQAEKGSGALITAEYSRKYGREVEME